MKPSIAVVSLTAALTATAALAGDADVGRQLSQRRCAACHVTGPWRGDVLAAAPPFETIARSFPAEGGGLIVALRGPHRRMNFRPSQGEAEDIAAYIRSLAH